MAENEREFLTIKQLVDFISPYLESSPHLPIQVSIFSAEEQGDVILDADGARIEIDTGGLLRLVIKTGDHIA